MLAEVNALKVLGSAWEMVNTSEMVLVSSILSPT